MNRYTIPLSCYSILQQPQPQVRGPRRWPACGSRTWSPKSAPVGLSILRTVEEPSTELYTLSCSSVGLRAHNQQCDMQPTV